MLFHSCWWTKILLNDNIVQPTNPFLSILLAMVTHGILLQHTVVDVVIPFMTQQVVATWRFDFWSLIFNWCLKPSTSWVVCWKETLVTCNDDLCDPNQIEIADAGRASVSTSLYIIWIGNFHLKAYDNLPVDSKIRFDAFRLISISLQILEY